jgi:FHIPEP family
VRQPPIDTNIPIRLDLVRALAASVQADTGKALALKVADETVGLLRSLGLPGEPEVTVRSSTATRPLRVAVHGAVVRYPMRLLRSAPDLAPLSEPTTSFARSPASWTSLIDTRLRGLPTAADADDSTPLEWATGFASWLAMTAIQLAPSCLVGDGQAAAYLGATGLADPGRVAYVKDVLRGLLDLGVNVTARDTVLGASDAGITARCKPSQVVEQAFRVLRGYEVRIVAHPQYLAELGSPAPESSTPTGTQDDALRLQLEYVGEAVRADLGLPAPKFSLVAEPSIRKGWMAVELHDQRGWPGQGLKPGNLLVHESARRIAQRGLPVRAMQNPYTGEEAAEVSGSAAPNLDAADLKYWDAGAFAAILAHLALRRRVGDLVGAAEVEYRLQELSKEQRDLVELTTGLYTVTELIGVLRALVREGLPIQDLRSILEQLVRYDIGLLMESYADCSSGYEPNNVERLTSAVRRGLSAVVTEQHAGRSRRLLALRTDREFEQRACALRPRRLSSRDTPPPAATPESAIADEQAADHLLDRIWAAVTQVSEARARPVLVTSDGARWAVRHLVESEIPELPVLAVSELRPDVDVVLLPWKEDRMAIQYSVVCDRVARILTTLAGPSLRGLDSATFSFYRRSTEITVRVSVWHGQSTVVAVSARPDLTLPADPAVFERFATRPPETAVQVLLERVGDHVRPHCSFLLLGDFLDREELEFAISEVTSVSEELDATERRVAD